MFNSQTISFRHHHLNKLKLLGPVIFRDHGIADVITELDSDIRNGIHILSKLPQFSFIKQKLQANKLISTLWLANCHFYPSSPCLHVRGSRRSTLDAQFWMRTGQPIIKISVNIKATVFLFFVLRIFCTYF